MSKAIINIGEKTIRIDRLVYLAVLGSHPSIEIINNPIIANYGDRSYPSDRWEWRVGKLRKLTLTQLFEILELIEYQRNLEAKQREKDND